MAKVKTEPNMEEYAKERNAKKKPKVRSVTVKKAVGGFIVEVNMDDYSVNSDQLVYADLDGVKKCLEKKLG